VDWRSMPPPPLSPLADHDHIHALAPALATDQPGAPVGDRRLGAVGAGPFEDGADPPTAKASSGGMVPSDNLAPFVIEGPHGR
jgi:hypothetical protein